MDELLDITCAAPGPSARAEELAELRKALLLSEREKTRARAQRKLKRLVARQHPYVSPMAQGGLALSYFWSGDVNRALHWARSTTLRYPMTAAAVWCSSLIVLVFRSLGMRRERFEAEGERLRLMQRIAFQGENVADRAYALAELVKELEARDLPRHAQRWAQELRALIAQESPRRHWWAESETSER